MKRILCALLIAAPAFAVDVTNVNPSGIGGKVDSGIVLPVNDDPICGNLNFDGVNGLSAQRRGDGLESWSMTNCELEADTTLTGFCWLAIDNTDADWIGTADYSVWDGATVETGCADDSNPVAAGFDVTNNRQPLLDGGGNQVVLFGRNAWIYDMKVPDADLAPGKYYFAPRIVVGGGQSFILTVPCDGNKPTYFQSEFFGFPCAVPGSQVFGSDLCAAVQPKGRQGPPQDRCLYEVTKAKGQKDLCGNKCRECPLAVGDIICANVCVDEGDCRSSVKGVEACGDTSACKIKTNALGCGQPPRDCFRLGC